VNFIIGKILMQFFGQKAAWII